MNSIFDARIILRIYPERAFSGPFLAPGYDALEIRTTRSQPNNPIGSKIFLHHESNLPERKIPLTVIEIGEDVHLQSPEKNQWLISLRTEDTYFDELKRNYKEYT